MSNAADGFLGRDFLDHRSECRCDECELERAKNKVSALEARVKELEQANEALVKKYADCPHPKGEQYWPCACSYEKASDVCAVHAPQLKAALARVKELEEQVRWKPIMPESLPKVGDEVYRAGMNGSVPAIDVQVAQEDANYNSYRACGWTHYRPINPPAKEDAK